MGLPVSRTIWTASALNWQLNRRRCSGMYSSSQPGGHVQDPWYTSGARRVLKCGEQLTMQVGVGVQATALIARMSSGSIGETAARFLDEKNPWRVIPDVVAL